MKTIIIAIIAIMGIFANTTAHADGMDVQKYVLDTVPGATVFEARLCASAWQHGGNFMVKSYNITLECSKNSLSKTWDRPAD